ncbi:MAG: sulfatase [Chloroflexi bacterium]|nr:sulfatase [Chloroflexota bacterium]
MRILYLDCDTLRPDHLGCYGYLRDTSPNIDRLAAEGLRCTNTYACDAPCLPSRAGLFMGRFGIHTGVVGHGGTAADPRIEGAARSFRNSRETATWMEVLREAGFHTVSVSPFAERHSAWWFYRGFSEMYNPGKGGMERADEVTPLALDWIRRRGAEDNWFLQVNMWDPHTPYRAPLEYGNPFAGQPMEDWITEEKIAADYAGYGAHGAHEPWGYGPNDTEKWPRLPHEIATLADYRQWIDGYDTGIKYMDDHIGQILDALEEQGVLDETVVIVSSDHGENQGELGVYGDHHTADYITSRVPLIIRWPGLPGGRVDHGLHYNLDLPPTMAEMLGARIPAKWDGECLAATLRDGTRVGRDYLVVSQCAWSCQRAVRFGPWMLIRTYHDGLKDYPPVMLFNVDQDPHEMNDLSDVYGDIVHLGLSLLERWQAEMMSTSDSDTDPLWTVMREGGPFHTRGHLLSYSQRLRETGRAQHAETLLARHKPTDWDKP